jgi:TANFOR domain-containing protein
LQISVTVIPPFPSKAEGLLGSSGGNVLVTITNTARASQVFKLTPTLQGISQNFSISFNPNFNPASALSIGGNETRVFTYSQLVNHWGVAANPANWVYQGITPQAAQGPLPEGTYRFCVKAFDQAASGQEISQPGGACGTFNLKGYDPPIILQPKKDEKIKAIDPQFLIFNWTPTGLPASTRYRFELVDMTENKLAFPEDAFKSQAVFPYYIEDNITAPNLAYNLSKPPLKKGHKYGLRIIAYAPNNDLVFRNNGISQAIAFIYGETLLALTPAPVLPKGPKLIDQPKAGKEAEAKIPLKDLTIQLKPGDLPPKPDNDPVPDPTDGPGCKNSCTVAAPSGPAVNVTQGQEIVVGKFKMTVTQINGPNSGQGFINVPFLKTKFKVKFSNISVNAQSQMFAGKLTGIIDAPQLIDQALADSDLPNLATLQNKLEGINQKVAENARRVSMMTGQEAPIGLPVSLDNQAFNLVIAGILFTPTEAFIHTVTGIPVPESISGDLLNFHKSKIGIRPNGFCNNVDLKITLAADQVIQADQSGTNMRIKGGNNGSFIDFDCKGVKGIQVKGEMEFPESKLKRIENGKVVAGKVKALFETYATDFNDWIIDNATLQPATFTTPSANGFIFTASNIVFDHSTKKNANGFSIHQQHPMKNQNLWTGLFIKNLSLQFPEGFFNANNQALKLDFTNVIIDKTGFWGDFTANNILDNGNIAGWKFSISQFGLDLRASAISGGSLKGGIELPISEQSLNFDCAISAGEGGADFDFGIVPGPVDMNLWLAQLDLDNNTVIHIKKENGKFLPKATLSGKITLGWTKGQTFNGNKPSVKEFNFPDLEFHNLVIETHPQTYIPSIKSIQLPNDNGLLGKQGGIAGFPITVSNMKLDMSQGMVGVGFTLGLRLDNQENGIGGTGAFTIRGKLNNNKKFVFDGIQFDAITVAADMGFASLNGGIQLFQDHEEYGDGFLGWIDAGIKPISLNLSLVLQAGKKDDYRYWMFDASLKVPSPGIVITPGFSLYGLMGGGYNNMSRQAKYDQPDITQAKDVKEGNEAPQAGVTPSGDKYIPTKGFKGFKAGIIFGLSGSEQAFSGDVTFGIDLGDKLNVLKVYLDGNGYVMAPLDNRDGAAIKGSAYVEIIPKQDNDPNTPSMLAEINVEVNVATIVKINVPINMYFSPQDWYVYMGSWDQDMPEDNYDPALDQKRIQLNIDIPVIDAKVNFNAYFMMGTIMPPGLPPLPKKIRDEFPNGPKPSATVQAAAGSGLAFATGASLGFNVDLDFFILYAKIDLLLGFDGMIRRYVNPECGGKNSIGVNNWYATAQAYAFLHVDGGLQLNLWVYKGRVSILKFTTAALLRVEGPNPMWIAGNFKFKGEVLGGLIKVETNFYAEVGQKCTMGTGTPFDDLPIVSMTDPDKGDEKIHPYTDPQIAFNFPRNMFSIEAIDDKGNLQVKYFSYGITEHKFTYKEKNSNATKNLAFKGGPYYGSDNYSCKHVPDPYLPGEATVSYSIKVRGYEHPAGLINSKVPAGNEQVTSGSFTTDKLPDAIMIDDIITSIPERRQRFFLKGSFLDGKIRMSKGQCSYLFRPSNPENPSEKYVYKARFTNLKTKEVSEVNCSCTGQEVKYSIPQDLKLSSIYSLEIVRRNAPVGGNQQSESVEGYKTIGGSGGAPKGGQQLGILQLPPKTDLNKLVLPPQNPNPNLNKILLPPGQQPPKPNMQPNLNLQAKPEMKSQSVSIMMYDRQLKGQIQSVKEDERVLLTYHFKTSMFNTKEEKLNQMKEIPQFLTRDYEIDPFQIEFKYFDFHSGNSVELPIFLAETKENFDQFDVNGTFFGDAFDVQNNKHVITPALFTFTQPENKWDWVGKTFYSISSSEYGGIYETPDQQDYIYAWPVKDLSMETVIYEDRENIIWPDWHSEYYPGYDESPFWSETRFSSPQYLAWPFAKLPWMSINRKFPNPYIGFDKFAFVMFYDETKHGYTNKKGYNVVKPMGNLTQHEINQAMQPQGVFSQNLAQQPQKMYVGFIDFTEWVTKRDFTRFLNYVLNKSKDKVSPYTMESDPYYSFGYLPIRNYMAFYKYYQNRPAGNYRFKLGGKEYLWENSPALNTQWKF